MKDSTDVWSQPFWSVSNEANGQVIDHSNWDRLLKKYVVSNHSSKINRFRYGDVSGSGRQVLAKYITGLSQPDPRAYRVFADHPADFAKNQANLLKLLAHYVDDRTALYLLGFQGDIEYHNNLALNAP